MISWITFKASHIIQDFARSACSRDGVVPRVACAVAAGTVVGALGAAANIAGQAMIGTNFDSYATTAHRQQGAALGGAFGAAAMAGFSIVGGYVIDAMQQKAAPTLPPPTGAPQAVPETSSHEWISAIGLVSFCGLVGTTLFSAAMGESVLDGSTSGDIWLRSFTGGLAGGALLAVGSCICPETLLLAAKYTLPRSWTGM